MRDSFVFYRSFYEAIRELPRDIQGEIYTAIMEYGLYGNETENLKPIARSIFMLVKPLMDANYSRYENGCKGGRPKGGKNQTETKRKPNRNQTETKRKPNVDVDVDVDIKKTSSTTKQKKADGDTPREDGQGLQDGETMPLQAGTLPAAQKEKSCAKKEKAPAERTAAQAAELLGTEAIIAEIERRAITAEQLAMANGLDAAGWQAVKAEIFTQWRFEGYSNTLQDALNHFANLVRKKAGDLRKGGGRQAGKSAVDAMVAGMLAAARSPEQERAEEEQFKRDFGL